MGVSPAGMPPKVKVTFERLAEPAKDVGQIDSSQDEMTCIVRLPDGSTIASGDEDGVLKIWDGWTGESISGSIEGHTHAVCDVKFSPDGTRFVSAGSDDKAVKIWDARSGKLILQLKADSQFHAFVYSPDGCRVVSGHGDGRVRIWDAQNGALVVESQDRQEGRMLSVAYSPGGKRLVSGSVDGTLMIWDAESCASVGKPMRHGISVCAVAYSPDGSKIVSGSWDDTVLIWDADTGVPIGEPLRRHESPVNDVGYSQDGKSIISISADKTICFWNATTGVPIGTLRRGESRWDPENQHFASIPRWFPRLAYTSSLRVHAIIYSANPLYVPDDGWIRTLDGGLFLWVPPEHRACSCHIISEGTVTANPQDERLKNSAWKSVPRGRDWAKMAMNKEESERD